MFEEIFTRQKLKPECLLGYGFAMQDGRWTYSTAIMGGDFTLHVYIDDVGDADTDLIENATGDEYVLYKTGASGSYVGEIRQAIEKVLAGVVAECYEPSAFKTDQSLLLIEHVRTTYGDELEFLWQKFPDNAVWRRKDNQKWYAAILTVVGSKIGLETGRMVEIVDLRMRPEKKEEMLAREHYYPGWHMNKKNWYTIVLDAGVSDGELCQRLDESYALAAK